MATISEKLDAMFDALMAKFGLHADERNTKAYIIATINSKPTPKQVENYYMTLSSTKQKDPDVLHAYTSRIADPVVAAELQKSAVEVLIDAAEKPFAALGKKLAETYMKITPSTPETALDVAIGIVGLDFAKDIGVGIAGLTAETVGFGQIETMSDFFKFFKSKTSYGGVMTMLMKAPLELGLYAPLSYGLHAQFRDVYLRGNTALILATKGHISEEQMRKAYSYEGYPEWSIDAIVKDRWRELRLGEIAWAFNDGMVDAVWLNEKLRVALYDPLDRPKIIEMIQAKYLRPYRDRLASQLRNQYKEGYISAKDFRIKLADTGIPLVVRGILETEADLLFSFDMNADRIAAWEAQYLKTPSMTDAELRALYSSIIVDPARIEPRISKIRAQRSKTPALPKPTAQGVKVSSRPAYATILLDDADTGKLTPETIETSIGTHTLILVSAGYEPVSYTFSVVGGQFEEIYSELTKNVTVEAEAEISKFVDEFLSGTANEAQLFTNLMTVAPNRYAAEMWVRRAMSLRPVPKLVKEKIITQGVKISSKPSNAYIMFDDADTGKITPETIETSIGMHTLTVSADGYEPYSEEVTVVEGQFVEIYAVLVPLLPPGSAGPG